MAAKKDIRLTAAQDAAMREYRHALSRVMHTHFEFFAAMSPREAAERKSDLGPDEIAAVSASAKRLLADLGRVASLLAVMERLSPRDMTPARRSIYRSLVMADLRLRGDGRGIQGWIEQLGREQVARWVHGLVPDAEMIALMHKSRFTRHPLTRTQVRQILKDRWEDGWRPRAIDWVSQWANRIKLTIFRMQSRAFEFTEEIDIQFVRMTEEQSDAFKFDIPTTAAGRRVRESMRRRAQKLADEEEALVQILDSDDNIVGEAVPSKDAAAVFAGTEVDEKQELKPNLSASAFDEHVFVMWCSIM